MTRLRVIAAAVLCLGAAPGLPEARIDVPVLLVPGWFDTERDLAALRIRLVSAGWESDHVATVTFSDPENRMFTLRNVGDDAADSDPAFDGTTITTSLEAGEYDPTVDAGIVVQAPPPQIAFTGARFTLALLSWGIGFALLGWALLLLGRKPEEDDFLVVS